MSPPLRSTLHPPVVKVNTANGVYRREDNVDLEAEFKPSLLNSAVYLLQLIQQISTFAVNYQGRPFRESLSENKGMYWGIIGVTGIAFACSTEFIPELNQQMKLVPFTDEFKFTMTTVMLLDYVGCYAIEVVLKRLFSDFRPKDIAIRRSDQDAREKARKDIEAAKKAAEDDVKREAAAAELERKIEERRQKIRAWSEGRAAAR
jgi:manganese-transporting P-type ATPase